MLSVFRNLLHTTYSFHIFGDFNFNNVNWKQPFLSTQTKPFSEFKNYLDAHNLSQLITLPTHCHGSTLDLFITSRVGNILSLDIREEFTNTCDHNMIEIRIDVNNIIKPAKPPRKRNFYRGDYDKINTCLINSDWDTQFSSDIINLVYSNFTSTIYKTIDAFIPLYKSNSKISLPPSIRLLRRTKLLLYNLSKSDSSAKKVYNELDKAYRHAVSSHIYRKEQQVLSSNNKKMFYGYINRKLKSNRSLPPLLDDNNVIVMESEQKAELLNTKFSKVFISDNSVYPDFQYQLPPNLSSMSEIIITPSKVNNAINRLKNQVSRTPENIPSYYIKKTKDSLVKPLARLFNLSLKLGKVPTLWKQALVTPIYKKGLRNKAENYRQVSLTSVFVRILESIIKTDLSLYLRVNQLLSNQQCGFVEGRSTLSQQVMLFDELTSNFDDKINSDMIYLDFAKAFDSVSHRKLLHVLQHLKVHKSVITWIGEYLTGRSQRTVVDGLMSTPCPVTSGVPQGSVLGPLLFLLYLDELIKRLTAISKVSVFAFADDLKILSSDANSLQTALNVVEDWSDTWQLRIQPTKSEYISFSRSSSSSSNSLSFNSLSSNSLSSNTVSSNTVSSNTFSSNTFFTIASQRIPETTVVRDLGILIENDFKTKSYISQIYSKTINLSYSVIRNFRSRDPYFYVNLYKLYIRPHLEYNTCIWNPILKSEVRKIESVQARFTRNILKKLNIKYNSYENRLNILNLETLEVRRVKFDPILTFKIINNLIDLDSSKFFTLSQSLRKYRLRRHCLYLEPPKLPETTIRNHFFSYRIINIWNQLPEETVTCESLSLFKAKLNKLDLYQFFTSKL